MPTGTRFIYCQDRPPDKEVTIEELTPKIVSCTECDQPATVYINCPSCEGLRSCETHFDSNSFYYHADHDCSPECCARNHRPIQISEEELEKLIPRIEVTTQELGLSENHLIWLVETRRKTPEEIEGAKIEMATHDYRVKEWPHVRFSYPQHFPGFIMKTEQIEGNLISPYLYNFGEVEKLPPSLDRYSRVRVKYIPVCEDKERPADIGPLFNPNLGSLFSY